MTEGKAYEILIDSVGNLCDCWQDGKVNDQEFIKLFTLAGRQWLDDQIANTPE